MDHYGQKGELECDFGPQEGIGDLAAHASADEVFGADNP